MSRFARRGKSGTASRAHWSLRFAQVVLADSMQQLQLVCKIAVSVALQSPLGASSVRAALSVRRPTMDPQTVIAVCELLLVVIGIVGIAELRRR